MRYRTIRSDSFQSKIEKLKQIKMFNIIYVLFTSDFASYNL